MGFRSELFDAIAIENGRSLHMSVLEDPGTFGEKKPSPGLTVSVTKVDETNGGVSLLTEKLARYRPDTDTTGLSVFKLPPGLTSRVELT